MVLVSLFGILDEVLDLGIDLLTHLGVQLDQPSEQSDEVNQSANREDRDVAHLLDQIGHMGDDDLWQDLEDHGRAEGLPGGAA